MGKLSAGIMINWSGRRSFGVSGSITRGQICDDMQNILTWSMLGAEEQCQLLRSSDEIKVAACKINVRRNSFSCY